MKRKHATNKRTNNHKVKVNDTAKSQSGQMETRGAKGTANERRATAAIGCCGAFMSVLGDDKYAAPSRPQSPRRHVPYDTQSTNNMKITQTMVKRVKWVRNE